jgi:hypothetical protein
LILLIIVISTIFITGCSNTSVAIWDGVIRNDNGESLNNFYGEALVTEQLLDHKAIIGDCFIASNKHELPSGESYIYTGETDGRTITLELRKVTILDLTNNNTQVSINLHENVTTVNQGEPVQTINLNRDYIYKEGVGNYTFDIYNGSTIDLTSSTLLLPLSEVLTSEKKQSSFISQEIQYTLRRNTTYAINATNDGAGDIELRIQWRWCENEKTN